MLLAVWESTVKRPEVDGGDMRTPALTLWRALVLGLGTIKTWTLEAVSCGFCAQKTRLDRGEVEGNTLYVWCAYIHMPIIIIPISLVPY